MDYGTLIEKIARLAKVPGEEVERKVEAKRAKLSGLISKEGAAQIVAAELGIVFENEKLKIAELAEGMKKANLIGQVLEIFPIRKYNKNGREGSVGSFSLGDDSSSTRVVLWDTNHIGLIEDEKIKQGDFVEINNASVRNGEIHLSAFSDLKKSKEKIDNVVSERKMLEGKLIDVSAGKLLKSRALIVQVFDPKYFTSKDGSEKKNALVNIVIDDGTNTLRCVAFGDALEKLGFSEEEIFSLEKFTEAKGRILGEEFIVQGSVRNNQYFNVPEMSIQEIEKIDTKKLIAELEAKT